MSQAWSFFVAGSGCLAGCFVLFSIGVFTFERWKSLSQAFALAAFVALVFWLSLWLAAIISALAPHKPR